MSVAYGLIRAVIEHNTPLTTLLEHGIDERFFRPDERKAYLFVKDFKQTHGSYPQLKTVAIEAGKPSAFREVELEPVEYWIPQLRQRYQAETADKGQVEIRDLLKKQNIEGVKERIKDLYEQIQTTERGYEVNNLADLQWDVLERHKQIQLSPGISGINFGFPSLDEDTYGQQGGDFNVLVGVTGVCKSWFSLKTAFVAYMQGYNVMFLSPELPKYQISRRLLAMQARLKDKDIRKGQLSMQAVKKAEKSILDMGGKENYFKIPESGMYLDINKVTTIAKEYKPDLLVVDGFYMLQDYSIKSHSPWKVDESVIYKLKETAIFLDIPVLGSTQYNRSKPGKVEGAKGTQSVELTSSMFFSLEFEHADDREIFKPEQTRILRVKKGRDGSGVTLRIKINFNHSIIEEDCVLSGATEEERPEDGIFIDEI